MRHAGADRVLVGILRFAHPMGLDVRNGSMLLKKSFVIIGES
jgi:hypothetical protein